MPGAFAARALGIAGERRTRLGRWMMTPALGLVLYGPAAFFILAIIGFSMVKILVTWILFIAAASWVGSRKPLVSLGALLRPTIHNSEAVVLIALAAMGSLLPTSTIYPYTSQGGLYTDTMLADHVKIAFIDGIVREGMPLKNPFYAPHGKRILLSYSYGWYLPGAIAKEFAGCTGWEAEVAMTWLTTFAFALFLAAMACALSGGAAGGFWLIVVAGVGALTPEVLVSTFGPRSLPIFGLPRSHGLEVPWLQLAWAPQHVFGALAVFITLWLASAALVEPSPRKRFIIGIALASAMGFEASSWVGGVAIAAATPVLIIGAAALRLPRAQYVAFARTMAVAVALCALAILPLLIVFMRGTPQAEHAHSVGFGIFPTTQLEDHLHLHGNAKLMAMVVLYWVHLLPLSYGVIYIVGLPAMIAFRPRADGERTFRAVAIAGTIGFLLVSQFIQSTIRANDLGWRAVNVAVMFLCVFAAVAIADLFKKSAENVGRWRLPQWMPGRPVLVPVVIALLTMGLLSTARVAGLPIPLGRVSKQEKNLHRAYAMQRQAWADVRRFAGPKDLVQANPDAFSDLPPWAISLPYHLFANRSSAWSCDGTGRTYAFRYSWQDNIAQGELITSLFSANPTRQTIKAVRKLGVKVLLITPGDAVWQSRAIQSSGFYRLRVHNHDYKIYVAVARRSKSETSPHAISTRSAGSSTQTARTAATP